MKHFSGYEKRKRAFRRFKMLRSVAFLVVVCLLAIAFAMSSTQVGRAYVTWETHAPLVDKASEGYQLVDWNVKYGEYTVGYSIKLGNVAEDHPLSYDCVYDCGFPCKISSHFWDVDNGGPWAPVEVVDDTAANCSSDCKKNALYKTIALTAKAISEYRQGYYELSYAHLGHITHLLQDQSVPAHAHEHNHSSADYYERDMETLDDFFTWDGSDSFLNFPSTPVGLIEFPEGFCERFSDHSEWQQMWEIDEWKNYLTFPLPEEPPCPNCVSMQYDQDGKVVKPCENAYGLGLAKIAYLMYTTNQYADWWASYNDGNGFSYGDADVQYFTDWIDYSELEELGWDNQTRWPSKVQAHYNYRYAMRATATLFQVFEEMTKPTLTVNSLDDHPNYGTCDEKECTLREAIQMAAPMATIRFADNLPGDTITLKETLTITKDLTIDASHLPANIAISGDSDKDGEPDFRVISVDSGHVILKGIDILKGKAFNGGGIYNQGGLEISDCAITGNQASSAGGGIYNNGGLTVVNCTFDDNESESDGGALFINSGHVVLKGLDILNGYADKGGGIYNQGGLDLYDCAITGNQASSAGGGIYNSGWLTVANCTFTDNSSETGGAIASQMAYKTHIYNSSFSNNHAGIYGGGISNTEGELFVANSLFFSNSAEMGGGVLSTGTISPTLTNVTLSENSAQTAGGGIVAGSGITLINSILWGNSPSGSPQLAVMPDEDNHISHSIIQGGEFDGVFTDDPLFVDAAGGDLHLQHGSPAIDVGSIAAIPPDTYDLDGDGDITEGLPFDLDGSPRISGVPNQLVDLGAYEYQSYIRYVKQDATGNCTSWEDACDLQAALAGPETNYEIWVAAGVYYPGDPGSRQAAFILKDGVAIYGGFTGGETSRAQRDWETNLTILSGDIGVVGDNRDNTYHVVSAVGLTETATLDGFTIIGGNADAPTFPEQWGGGLYAENSNLAIRNVSFKDNSAAGGGGMFINGGADSVVLENVEFFSNTATVNGGGLHTYNGSSPELTNVTFSDNSAADYGGGMINFAASDPPLVNVIFSGNSARYGGGMFNYNNSDPTLTNVIFSGNSAEVGGGMYNFDTSSPILTNVTFSGNSAIYHGGGMDNQANNKPVLTNCILWGNTAPNGAQIYNGTDSSATINYSLVQDACPPNSTCDDHSIFIDPLFVSNPDPGDGDWLTIDDNDYGDLRLQFTSPAIDAGGNVELLAEVTTDLDGSPRIINDYVDMGAYEMRRSPIYVDPTAKDGANNGSSWADAYLDLQAALGVVDDGKEIWVAKGIYTPGGDQFATFKLPNGSKIYGGFAGGETELGQRDWKTNPTILSGDIDRDDDTTEIGVITDTSGIKGTNAYRVVSAIGISETTTLDGFIITGGYNKALSSPQKWGGGLYAHNSNLVIQNVLFEGNLAEAGGGMFSNGGLQPVLLEDVEFRHNTATINGGGMHTYDGSNPTLINVTFSENSAVDRGGGMINHSRSSPALTRVTFIGNTAKSGGGMYNFTNSNPTLTNLTFSGNSASVSGGGMENSTNSNPTLTNVTFSGNTAKTGGGIRNFDNSDPSLVNVIFSGNEAFLAGGGILNTRFSDSTLTNVTFTGNSAGSGGGIFNELYSYASLVNAILWDNSFPQIYSQLSSNVLISYSAIQGGWSGTGNINQDPQFVDAAGGNLHLQYTSPAIDAGDPAYCPSGDIRGWSRPFDGDGDGVARCDMGAYEVHTAPPEAVADTYVTDEDTPLNVDPAGVLTNDTDVDGDLLTAVLDTDVSKGTLTLNADGSFDYIPYVDFNGSDNFTYHANDGQADSNTVTVTITVNPVNDAPVVKNTSNNGPVQEGGSATITVSAYDVDILNNYIVENQENPAGMWVIGNRLDQRVIALNVTSNDGGESLFGTMIYAGEGPIEFRAIRTAQNTYEVENQWGGGTAPWNPGGTWILGDRSEQNVVAIDISSNDEGATLTGMMTYAGEGPIGFRAVVNDLLTYSYDCDGDSSYEIGPQSSNSTSCSYGDDGDFTVTVLVEDDDGGSATSSTVVTVNNVAPTVTLLGLDSVDEGQTKTFSYTVSDPGADTFTLDSNSCGTAGTLSNSSFNSASGAGGFNCTFPDGLATSVVSVTVSDDDGGSGSATREVTVQNVAPSVSPAEDQTIPLGYTDALQLGSFIDPGSQDAPWAIKVDWGDGSTPNSWSISAVGDLNPLTHSFSSAGWYTVEVTVSDKDGEPGSAQFQITVENPAPKISAITPLSVLAGESTDLSLQILGSDFVSTSQIRWDRVDLDTTFMSQNEIHATIPFSMTETARTAEITVYNPEPGGGISTPMAFFVTKEDVTVDDYSAATSTDPGESATASTENSTVEAIGGTGTVVVAEYSGNPGDTSLFKSNGDYFDVYLSSDSSFQQLEITFYNVNNGSSLTWLDGGSWLKIKDAIYNPDANTVTFVVTAETVPSIEQLSGTVFGLVDDAPYAASASLSEQTVQYSDSIIPIALEARDAGDGVMTANVDLPWLNISEAICSMDGSNTICTWTLTGTASVPAGSYPATVSVFDSAQNQVEIPISIIVSPEDTAAIFHSGNPVAVKVTEDGGASGLFELEVRVSEAYPDNVPDGSTSYPGDISLGQVSMKLVPVGPGGEVNGDCSLIGVFDEGYDAFQRVVCSFDAVPVNTYLATVTVDGGYYAGLGEEVLVVYDPSRGYTTGGGWFYWPGTEERTSFGFTMEYNNTGSNVKGSMLLIRHSKDGSIYQIKSNALYGISLGIEVEEGETFGWASFSGKATYLEPGWIEAIGNHEYMIYVEDRNDPGSGVDQFWIEVRDKNGNKIALMSMPRPAIDNTEQLSEGNIFVPH